VCNHEYVDLTNSYTGAFSAETVTRYDWAEVRNAASILKHTNPGPFSDLGDVLASFSVDTDRDIAAAGGNESDTAAHLNSLFRSRGWREGSYGMRVTSELKLLPFAPAGETTATVTTTEVLSPSYLVDNIKGRVALDVEWHAKDGNLDRDIAAYRALYDAGIIDGGVMLTMNRGMMREWALELLGDPLSNGNKNTKFITTTTTNLEKVTPRLTRGDAGGCPILIVAVCRRTV